MDPKPCLTVQSFEVAPVRRGPDRPFWDATWIAPQLHELLFAPKAGPQDGPPSRTYLIVDATLRTRATGLFDLDVLPLPVRCLFQGEAQQNFAASAPYLVDLTLPETGPTSFHKRFFAEDWEKGTGIVLRSTAPMDAIWSHFRKFTLIEGAAGRSMFFRFWETNTLYDYFSAVAMLPERARDLFCLRSGELVDLILGHSDMMSRNYLVRPDPEALSGIEPSRGRLRLHPDEERALYRGVLRGHAKQIERRLPAHHADLGPAEREALVFDCVCRMRDRGILQLDQIETQVEWELRTAKGGPRATT